MSWTPLLPVSELYRGDATPVTLDGHDFAIFDTTDGLRVSDNRCTHAGAGLCDGYFDGRHIECPLHQGLFDARTGKALAAPVSRDLKMYPTRVVDDMVEIDL